MRSVIILIGIFILGGILQILFWKTPDKTIIQALFTNSILWVIYFVGGILCLEHVFNFFRRRIEKQNQVSDTPITGFIFFALEEEAKPFRKAILGKIPILLTGIGKTNAEKIARTYLRNRKLEFVFTCGFAGGLNPDLKTGDVIFEIPNRRDELHESPSQAEARDSQSSSLRNKLLAAGAKPAKFFCADRIATTVAEKKELREQTGADAVEMESTAIYAVCDEHEIPCAVVRVISDTANEDLPLDFNKLAKPDLNLDFGKLFLAIAKSPGKIPALMELQKKTKFAAEQLADVLEKIIS